MRRNEHRILANMSVTACRVCGLNYLKYSVAWILSSCHKSLEKVFTGTMGMVVSVCAPALVSYSAPNKDTCLLLTPFRSKCCQLDVPLLMNWAFAPQLGVLIPQRVVDFQGHDNPVMTVSIWHKTIIWLFINIVQMQKMTSLMQIWILVILMQ